MKKWIIVLLGFIVLVVIFSIWFNQPCQPPERPNNVPKQAIWSGGCDGGEWIELIAIEDDRYRFKIYQDWSGELKIDTEFKFKDERTELTKDNWKNIICCYSHSTGSLVFLNVIKSQKKHYTLQSVYPAYDGNDWKIIKEKYNFE